MDTRIRHVIHLNCGAVPPDTTQNKLILYFLTKSTCWVHFMFKTLVTPPIDNPFQIIIVCLIFFVVTVLMPIFNLTLPLETSRNTASFCLGLQ